MKLVTSLTAVAVAAAVAAVARPSEKEDTGRVWLTSLPRNITFECQGRIPGYYADVDSGCQMYHMCDPQSRLYSYLCPAYTEFSQFYMTCVQHDRVNCSMSEKFFHMNEMIGKPRMRFHGHRQHDNSKKKDKEGSKANNRVETSEPAGQVLFEIETKIDLPLKKNLRSRPRVRPPHFSAGQTATSGRSRLTTTRPAGQGSPRPGDQRATNWGIPSPAAPRRTSALAGQTPQNRGRGAPKPGNVAPSGGKTVATSTERAFSAAAVPSTPASRVLFSTLGSPRAGGLASAATERGVTTAGTVPHPSLTTPASTVPLATDGTTPPSYRTGVRSTVAGRASAAGGDLKGSSSTTQRPRSSVTLAGRLSSQGVPLNTTASSARRVKPRVRFSDLSRDVTTTTERSTLRTSSNPIAILQSPTLPRNTYRTFGLPGSFAFGTLLNLENSATPLPVRTHATITATEETTAGVTRAPPSGASSTITPPARARSTLSSPFTSSSRSTTKTLGGTEKSTTAKPTALKPRTRPPTARTTNASKAASLLRTSVRSTTAPTTESTTKPTTTAATAAKPSTSQASTPKSSKEQPTTRHPTTERRTTTPRTTTKPTTTTAKPATTKSTSTKSATTKPTTTTSTVAKPTTTTATTTKPATTKPTATKPTTTKPTTTKLATTNPTTAKPTTTKQVTTRPTHPRSRTQQSSNKTPQSTTESSTVIPQPSTGTRGTTSAAPSPSSSRQTSEELPSADELEALRLSFTIEPPSLAVKADGPHEERNMKVRGELITGEMALRKLMVEQLNPVYFPNPSVPLNLLPPLLSEQEEPDGRQTTTLTLPVRPRQPNSLFQAAAAAFDLLPPELASLVPPLLTTPAPPSVQTPLPSTGHLVTLSAQETPAASSSTPSSQPTVKPREDPPGLTMKFGKKKKRFRVGDAHGSKDGACYPCMKSFIKDLENCHPCVVIR